MWKPSLKIGTLVILSSILGLGSVACNSNTTESPPSPSQSASPVPKSQASPKPAAKGSPQNVAAVPGTKAQAKPDVSLNTAQAADDTYQQAIDIASGAITISKSAVSRDDWNLVASQWQEAIKLLKAVPASSPKRAIAQTKAAQYQRFLADAKVRATPVANKAKLGNSDLNPQFFSIPIIGRNGGTPIVEVTFNGTRKFEMLFDTGATGTLITRSIAYALQLKPTGQMKVTVADGATVALYATTVKTLEVDGRLKRKLEVAIAPPAMPIGLLGQDFFEGYDITIKQDVIEFRRR